MKRDLIFMAVVVVLVLLLWQIGCNLDRVASEQRAGDEPGVVVSGQ